MDARGVTVALESAGMLGRVAATFAEEALREAGLLCQRTGARLSTRIEVTPDRSVELPLKNLAIGLAWAPGGVKLTAPFGGVLAGLFGAPIDLRQGRAEWQVSPGLYGPVPLHPGLNLSIEVS
ncbi:hypothetical protein L6R46_04340 [Myxococcota bacterium]|nr:hypothetical protein [Myxococcota bacterium]